MAGSLAGLKPPVNTGFRVPEDDNDSSSEVSIADSLQILDSDPRPRTYSVPSSVDNDDSMDEDGDMLGAYGLKPSADVVEDTSNTSKPQTQQSKDRDEAFTNLHQGIYSASLSKMPATVLPKSIGASKSYPIDLEDAQNRQDCIDIVSDSESDSDDEGPEILSVGPTSVPNTANPSLDEDSPEPNHASDQRASKLPHEQMLKSVDPLDIGDLQSEDDYGSPREASAIASVGSSVNQQSQPSTNLEALLGRHVTFKVVQPATQQSQVHESHTDKETSKDPENNAQASHPVVPFTCLDRAPSPSDAALVKKPSVVDASDDEYSPSSIHRVQAMPDRLTESNGQDDGHSHMFGDEKFNAGNWSREAEQLRQVHRNAERGDTEVRPLEEERYKKDQVGFDRQNRNWDHHRNVHGRSNGERYVASKGIDHWDEPLPSLFEDSHEAPPNPGSYRNGPFSIRSELDSFESAHYTPCPPVFSTATTPFAPYPGQYHNTFKNTTQQPPYCQEYAYGSVVPFDVDWSSVDYSSRPHSGLQKRSRPLNQSSALNSMPTHKPLWAEKHVTYKPDEGQPPRVPIADLLTPPLANKASENKASVEPELLSPPMSPPCKPSELKGTKRKAAEFEADDIDVVQDSVGNASLVNAGSQRSLTTRPDAQPQEPAAPAETKIIQTSQDSFVLQGQGSAQSQLKALAARETGPARKKARTLSSKTGGIAKFISGVAVGVVGVVAAFIATIPDSVREEALQEASKLK